MTIEQRIASSVLENAAGRIRAGRAESFTSAKSLIAYASTEEAWMKIITKAGGKRLKPWKIAETVFHTEEVVRAEHLELVQKAHLVPESERKKHDGKNIFQPGEVFFMTMETEKGPAKVPHIHWRSVVDCGEHYRFLNPDGTLGERVTSAIKVGKEFQP